jgi:hypothetical protein
MVLQKSLEVKRIQEINDLWEPIYPYLARHIRGIYGRRDGRVLEIGPFCGVIFSLQKKHIGTSFHVAAFPAGMWSVLRRQAADAPGSQQAIEVHDSDPTLEGIEDNSIDLAIFRGAFFFPSLFQVDFRAIHRVLRADGVAFVGGGFGKFTPSAVIGEIGARSKELNLLIGKTEVNTSEVEQTLKTSGITNAFQIITDGGLWVTMRR